ncbi:hypothetical protein [Burkholderia thailandensis]|uniref:hypothetical protein n=1 Tax=Burkholderia thailandensis TaxID=57975 RepID=UPI001392342F|nr:hypothetical protein [Burkholderia thailandensis]
MQHRIARHARCRQRAGRQQDGITFWHGFVTPGKIDGRSFLDVENSGEMCRFLEIGSIVTELSSNAVMLRVPRKTGASGRGGTAARPR